MRIQILGSVHWVTDPDPALFISGFQDAGKTSFFLSVYLLNVVHFYEFSLTTSH
jgi:hypothetical protein